MLLQVVTVASAQTDTSGFFQRAKPDTAVKMNMDASYNRPFFTAGKSPVAIGGYLEANTNYSQTDGVTDGFSFQARRLTLFLSSTIARRIKFLSEIEFEEGGREINIEFAAMDIEFATWLNLRGGIILNPIGAFNQNHDGPKWDFIERPLSATTIIPSTLSSAGFGLHGKHFLDNWILGYEAYLSNGFDDQIIANHENRTSLAAGKLNPERFEESNSGLPMFTGKIAIRNRKVGELGLSYMSGIYNTWRSDNLILDRKRNASVIAVDFNAQLFNKLTVTTEFAKVVVDVPSTYSQNFGEKQAGAFMDLIYTFYEGQILDWPKAKFNAGVRLEYVDYNQDNFSETGGDIGDEFTATVPTIAFRPVGTTVLRFNYRFEKRSDLLGNPPSRTGTIQFGFATYF